MAPAGLKDRDGEPVFEEVWQAQMLGIADLLVAATVISADAWSTTLGAELRKSAAAGRVDNAETYYRSVLAALQTLLYEAGMVAREEVDAREADWRSAYLNTPHGMPIVSEVPELPILAPLEEVCARFLASVRILMLVGRWSLAREFRD